MAVTDDEVYGQRTVTGVAPPPPPPPTAQQWTQQAPPTQPPPQARLAPAPAPAPQKPVVVDRVAYLQAQQQAMQQLQALASQVSAYRQATQNISNAGRYSQLRDAVAQQGVDSSAYRDEAISQLRAETGFASEAEVNQRAYDLAAQAATGLSRRLNAPVTMNTPSVESQFGVLSPTHQFGPLKTAQQAAGEVGRAVGEFTRIPGAGAVGEFVAESAVPTTLAEVEMSLIPGFTVADDIADVWRVFKGGGEAALSLTRKLERSEAGQSLLRRLMSEAGAVGGKGDPEDILEAGVRAVDAEGVSPARLTDNPPPSPVPVPENVVAAIRNRNKAVAKDPAALARSWELLPAENQKMIAKMADAVLTPAERKAITKAGQARQTARARQAIEETAGSTLDRARAGRAAMAGRYIPQIEPVGEAFNASEIESLFSQIDDAFTARTIIPQEHANATDAMELLLYGKRSLSPEKPLSLMPHEIKLLGRIYGPEFEAVLPKTAKELGFFDRLVDWANLPRAVIAGLDISAPGRQGIVLAARNPVEWGKAWGPMVKSMLSEANYTRELERMQTDDYFEDAVLHGLDFTDIGGGAAAEEAFQTRFIQDNAFLRNTVGRGERGYTVYLDKLRLSTYKKGAQRLERTAAKHGWDAERLDLAKKDWGGFVNHASGRGDLAGLNKYTPTFNALFFSPRFVISRPQTIWDLAKSDPAVRTMVGENLGAFVGSGVLLLTAAAAAGARVELDPRSSDFGKIRIGDQRIEFWGGFQPLARYITQVAMGDRKTLTDGSIVGVNRWKTVGRFLRSKLSPAGALGWDLLIEGGKNYEGENFLSKDQVDDELMNRLLPLVIQDAIEGYRAQGPLAGLRAGAVSAVGGGVGTFEPSEKEQQQAEKSKAREGSGLAKFDDSVYLTDQDWTRALTTRRNGESMGFTPDDVAKIAKDGYEYTAADGDKETATGVAALERLYADRAVEAGLYPDTPIGKAQALRDAGRFKVIKEIKAAQEQDLMNYWKANPQELYDLIQAEVVPTSIEKEKILKEAGLLP